MEKQTELAQLQGEHHAKVLEGQKLQRALDRKEQELSDLQQTKDQLEVELEDLQQQKKKGDKALNVRQLEDICCLVNIFPKNVIILRNKAIGHFKSSFLLAMTIEISAFV